MTPNCGGGGNKPSTSNSYTPKIHSASKGSYKPPTGNPFAKQGKAGQFGIPTVRMSFSGKKK